MKKTLAFGTFTLFSLLTITVSAQNTTERKDSLQGHLQGITVSGQRSDLKVENGQFTYNLNQIARRYTVNNAWEALGKLPGVSEKDGAYQLTGMNATVILNGKVTTMTAEQLTALLKNTPVNRVEKVEVMHSAPPQYHVRGAVLNVVLKQYHHYSVQGEVNGDYFNRFFTYGGVGGNLLLASPKVTLDVMYNVNRGKNIQTIDLYSRHTLKQQVYDIQQYQDIRSRNWKHNVRTALDWHISKDNSLNVAYTGTYVPSGKSSTQTQGNFQNSDVGRSGTNYMHNLSLAYTSGFGFQVGGDYTYYKLNNSQSLTADYTDRGKIFLETSAGQRIDRYNLYADQSIKLKENWRFGFGGSYTYAYDRDSQTYNKVEGDVTTQNTSSVLKEHTAEFYVSLGKRYSSGTSFSISATGESYKIGSYHRWSVYPQASFMYVVSPAHIIQLGLSTDKKYPSYWDTQSSISYLDGYSEVWGTPGLRPIKIYNANASYILHRKYVFTLFFNRSNDYFVQDAYQSTERLMLVYQNLNWNYSQRMGVQTVLPFTVAKWYDTKVTLIGMQMHQRADHYHDISFNKKKFLGVFFWDNSFRVNKHLLFNVDGFYQLPLIQGTYDLNSLFRLSLSARYVFLGDKASVTLKCYDVFNAGNPDVKVRLGQQYFNLATNKYSRLVSVHFSYRFGGYKKRNVKSVDTDRFGH